MNLEELKARIDLMYELSKNPKECIVYITTSEPSIGSEAKCGVKNINILLGFDKENLQVRIEPEKKLIKVESEE